MSRYTTPAERAAFQRLYKAGLSSTQIAALTGRPSATVCAHVPGRSVAEAKRLRESRRWHPLARRAGRMFMDGRPRAEIADALGCSVRTVYAYVRWYYEQIGIVDRPRRCERLLS